MLRKDLISGIHELNDLLIRTNLLDVLRNQAGDKQKDLGIGLRALNEYSVSARQFSYCARLIAETFGLAILEDPGAWITLLADSTQAKMRLYRSIHTLQTEMPKLLELLHQDTIQPSGMGAQPEAGLPHQVTVRISLIEDDGHFSTVERVIDSLSACQELYSALQQINKDISTPLAIGAIDSGSDKSFDLFGAAELMKQFRELVISLWGLVVFHKENKLGKKLDLISQSLPILERVAAMELNGLLGKEEAHIIRSKLIDGSKKFIASGVLTDDLEAHATHNPRLLLQPEPKLLSGPAAGEQPPSHIPKPHNGPDTAAETLSGLSEEDLDRLAKKLSGMKTTPETSARDEEIGLEPGALDSE